MKLPQAFAVLGVDPPSLEGVRTFLEAVKRLEDWKSSDLKSAYRKLAKRHHPDTGGDEEQMKRVNQAYQTIRDDLKIVRRQPARRGVVIRVVGGNFGGFGGTSAATTNTTTTTSTGWKF